MGEDAILYSEFDDSFSSGGAGFTRSLDPPSSGTFSGKSYGTKVEDECGTRRGNETDSSILAVPQCCSLRLSWTSSALGTRTEYSYWYRQESLVGKGNVPGRRISQKVE